LCASRGGTDGVELTPLGHAVVATGATPSGYTRDQARDDVLTVRLDVTDPVGADTSIQAAVDRFGRIDVLVNNAGNFNAGFFEEITPEDFRAQIETTLFGPINVMRAILPVMRKQRTGLVVQICSTAHIVGHEFTPPTPPQSSGWRAGSSPSRPKLRPSASARCS